MSKIFSGKCHIVINTRGEVALRRDDTDGAWSADQAAALYARMQEVARTRRAKISSYALFKVEGGTTPVLLTNRYGNPYLAVLPPQEAASSATSRRRIEVIR